MTGKDIKSKDKYFLAACNKEVRKGSSLAGSTVKTTAHNTTAKTIEVKVKAAAVEEKQAPPAVEVIERIKTIAPTELFEVIMTVDSDEKTQKALRFFSSDIVKKEILASHYLAAFKKEFPEIKIC
jgi:intergrase/recombinase